MNQFLLRNIEYAQMGFNLFCDYWYVYIILILVSMIIVTIIANILPFALMGRW